jgi:hypothetical protein
MTRAKSWERHGSIKLNPVSLVQAERQFIKRATGELWRNGWPDFLLKRTGFPLIGVEVKAGEHSVSHAQARMFAALEKVGLKTYIWNPAHPDVLTPWRSYLSKRERLVRKTKSQLQPQDRRQQTWGRRT